MGRARQSDPAEAEAVGQPLSGARSSASGCASGVRTAAGRASAVLELLHPGSFVKLRNHPRDLPPFELLHCRGGRCWVRQQSWGPLVHWEVPHRQLTRLAR